MNVISGGDSKRIQMKLIWNQRALHCWMLPCIQRSMKSWIIYCRPRLLLRHRLWHCSCINRELDVANKLNYSIRCLELRLSFSISMTKAQTLVDNDTIGTKPKLFLRFTWRSMTERKTFFESQFHSVRWSVTMSSVEVALNREHKFGILTRDFLNEKFCRENFLTEELFNNRSLDELNSWVVYEVCTRNQCCCAAWALLFTLHRTQ